MGFVYQILCWPYWAHRGNGHRFARPTTFWNVSLKTTAPPYGAAPAHRQWPHSIIPNKQIQLYKLRGTQLTCTVVMLSCNVNVEFASCPLSRVRRSYPYKYSPAPENPNYRLQKRQKKKPQASLTLSIRVLSIRKNGPNQQRLYCIARRFGDDGLHSLRSGNFAVAGSRSRIWVFSAGFRFGRWILFGSLSHGSFEALDYYHYYYL